MSDPAAEKVIIDQQHSGERVDVALARQLGISRSQIHKQLRSGQISREGVSAAINPSEQVHGGERFLVAPAVIEPTPAVPQLAILYEDDDLLVVDKPAGLVVHTSESGRTQPTVAAFAAAHGVIDNDSARPGIVHRLDKDTSGAMVLAKNPAAKDALQAQFKRRTVGKTYLALVRGRLAQEEAVIELPIGRDRNRPVKRAVVAGARPAITRYRTIRTYPGATLVEIELQTGRTHQIRVHFAHLGHPVVGDILYGDAKRPRGLTRQWLHAAGLRLTTPAGRPLAVESPLPSDLKTYLQSLEEPGII
ncbi:MAG TPA: RluA family pseudouridine synthase [Candidatus Saccharimonadales bacterium]|nr:RluA family pseudouridine synthase [Candidatus Saccharimonadales bacterium]